MGRTAVEETILPARDCDSTQPVGAAEFRTAETELMLLSLIQHFASY